MKRLARILIEFLPHKEQKYETVGNWFFEDVRLPGETAKVWQLTIQVSQCTDWRHEAMVAVHELVETFLCMNDGVTQEMVDEFDLKFEENRKEGDLSEPGDDPSAPYARQHCLATSVERAMCAHFGLSWQAYEDQLNSLA